MPGEMDPKLNLSFYLIGAGKPDEAIATLDWLGTIDKNDPLVDSGYCNLGMAHFVKKEYAKTIEDMRGIITNRSWCLAVMAANYVELGQLDTAKDSVKKILKSDPTYTIELFRRGNNISDKEALGRLTDGMRQAGLPVT